MTEVMLNNMTDEELARHAELESAENQALIAQIISARSASDFPEMVRVYPA